MIIVGLPSEHPTVSRLNYLRTESIIGSMNRRMPETQEMLDYCAEHNIGFRFEID